MVISSCLIFWKIKKNKRNYQMGIVLIITDSLFLLFRIPGSFNLVFNFNETNQVLFSFLNSLFTIISALHGVFSFVVFLIVNKFYHDLFIKLMKKIRRYFKINNQVSNISSFLVINQKLYLMTASKF